MSLRSFYLRWKALRLPWRRQFLIGTDLNGNTYWEFKDSISSNPNRMRRIVKGRRHLHHSDVQANISPLWHQWLRQTRADPPSLEEQQMDVQRQVVLKQNARLADERWNAKKKYIEKPVEQRQDRMEAPREIMEERAGVPSQASVQNQRQKPSQPDPWEEERRKQQGTTANPSGTWQPESWSPGPTKR